MLYHVHWATVITGNVKFISSSSDTEVVSFAQLSSLAESHRQQRNIQNQQGHRQNRNLHSTDETINWTLVRHTCALVSTSNAAVLTHNANHNENCFRPRRNWGNKSLSSSAAKFLSQSPRLSCQSPRLSCQSPQLSSQTPQLSSQSPRVSSRASCLPATVAQECQPLRG